MSDNPWEAPRHDNPLWHSTPNPTPQSPPMQIGDAQAGDANAGASYQAPAGTSNNAAADGVLFGYKVLPVSIVLAMVLGPLGLFYVSFVNGLAALLILPVVVRFVAGSVAAITGGSMQSAAILLPCVWCFTVPWAIIATRRHNAKRR
jgi:hypothetical protein